MIVNRDILLLQEQFNIRIPESTLIKLEDGLRNNKEMLITIAASHYGFRNRNWTIYRHDTVRNDIQSFVSPKPKPIIRQHRPDTSAVFGNIIAADYHLTDFYDSIARQHKVEKLSTEQYIKLMKDVILPEQAKNPAFDGLAYLELVGRLTNKEGIQKVLDGEFLRVSIGAAPNKLICSECGADQTKKICKHYGNKNNDTFMLAESLSYKELSFVDKPADPFGKITRIHDDENEEYLFESEINAKNAFIDAIPMKDFFQLTDKKIVCVDNICTIINREEETMKVKKSIGYSEEFGVEKLKALNDSLEINEQGLDELTDRSFAIVQKDEDGVKRRFPLTDEVSVKLAMGLLCDATDVSPSEFEKAALTIEKIAKKLGVDFELKMKDEESTDVTTVTDTEEQETTEQSVDTNDSEIDEVTEACQKIVDQLKVYIEENYNEDGSLKDSDKEPEKPSPIAVLFGILASFASEIRYAGNMLEGQIAGYLQQLGKEAVAKETKDELEAKVVAAADSLKDLEEENSFLSNQLMDLNRQLRSLFVEEILTHKKALGTLADGETSETSQYSKLGYESLKIILSDFRNMRVKLADNAVNNNVSITTVTDPTQIADSADSDFEQTSDSPPEQVQKKVTAQDAIDIINSLRTQYGL